MVLLFQFDNKQQGGNHELTSVKAFDFEQNENFDLVEWISMQSLDTV